MASLGEELLISADSHVIEDPALLGEAAARILQRPGAGFSRTPGGRSLSGTPWGVGPARARQGNGGGWGER